MAKCRFCFTSGETCCKIECDCIRGVTLGNFEKNVNRIRIIVLSAISSVIIVTVVFATISVIADAIVNAGGMLSEYAIYIDEDDDMSNEDEENPQESDDTDANEDTENTADEGSTEDETLPKPTGKAEYLRYNSLSEDDKDLYDKIYKAISDFKPLILKVESDKVNEEAERIADITYYSVLIDNPQIFWTGGGFQWEYLDSGKTTELTVNFDYYLSQEEAKMYSKQISEKVDAIVDGKTFNSDYEKAIFAYDWLCDNVEYNMEAAYGAVDIEDEGIIRKCYGPFIDGTSVCDGYARAFQMLMYKLDVPCTTVIGYCENEGHAWNVACVDGTNAHFDATWGDQITFIDYTYFGQTEAQAIESGKRQDPKSYWPECTSTAASYAAHTGNVTPNTAPNYFFSLPKATQNYEKIEGPSGTSYLPTLN